MTGDRSEDAVAPLPDRRPTDILKDAVVTVAAGVPLPVVGSVAELLDRFLLPGLERRRAGWLRHLADVVNEIARRVDGFDANALADDDRFLSSVVAATRIAEGEYLDEKIEMIKACLVNLQLPDAPPDVQAMRFLRLVGELQLAHFLVLRYASNPRAWLESRGVYWPPNLASSSPGILMDEAELPITAEERTLILEDLDRLGLTTSARLKLQDLVELEALAPWATEQGRQLVRFVTLMDGPAS